MKAKITKQKSGIKSRTALQLLRYLSDTKDGCKGLKKAELIFLNIPEINPVDQARALADMHKLRPKCKSHVYQTSLALPIGDDISHELWQLICLDYLEQMGLEPTNRPVVIYKHGDTDHRHVHIATSRIGYDGSLWSDGNDVYRAIEITQRIEKKYGLTTTRGFEGREDLRRLVKNEIEMSVRTGDLAPRAVIQQSIDQILSGGRITVQAFIEQLESVGITARPNCTATTFNGISFVYNGIPFKGSELGRKFTLKNLKIRGVEYEQDRDLEFLNARKAAANCQNTGVNQGVSDEAAGINPASDQADYREPKCDQGRDRDYEDLQRQSADAGRTDRRAQHQPSGTGRTDERCDNTAGAGNCRFPGGEEKRNGYDPLGLREQDQKNSVEVGKTDQGGSSEKARALADLSARHTPTGNPTDRAATRTAKTHILEQTSVDRMCLTMLREDCSRQQIEAALVGSGHLDTAWIILRALQALENERGVNPRSAVLKGL